MEEYEIVYAKIIEAEDFFDAVDKAKLMKKNNMILIKIHILN